MDRKDDQTAGRDASAAERATLTEWLDARTRSAPAELRAHMRTAIRAIPVPSDRAVALLEAAAVCIARAVSAERDRAAALDLLAADGLLTAACDVATDADEFAQLASSRLADLLPGGGA